MLDYVTAHSRAHLQSALATASCLTLGQLLTSQGTETNHRLCCDAWCDIGRECEPSYNCTWEVNVAVTAHGLNLAVTAHGLNLAVTVHGLSVAVTAHGVMLSQVKCV